MNCFPLIMVRVPGGQSINSHAQSEAAGNPVLALICDTHDCKRAD